MAKTGEVIPLSEQVRAYFSSKADGDLRRGSGGAAARRALCSRLGLRGLAAMEQVHGKGLAVARPGCEPQADGLLLGERGVGALAVGADCLLAALAGRRHAAALHLGWRSLAAGLLGEAIARLKALGERRLTVALGPGARGCCYEVGPEVAAALGLAPRRGKVDLPAVAARQAREAGIGRVEVVGECTICTPTLFSHRREGEGAGRQGVVVWLTE